MSSSLFEISISRSWSSAACDIIPHSPLWKRHVLDTFDVTLTRIRRLSGSTLDFRFVRDDGAVVRFEPGQFFRFTFEDAAGAFERSYSLCNFMDDAGDGPIMDLVISRVSGGRATALLFAAEVGMKGRVSGPYGRLVLPDPLPARLFLVATSVGIAPFLPMFVRLENRLARHDVEVQFLFGIRDEAEVLYRDFLTDFMDRHAGFSLSLSYSRECPPDPAPFEHAGYVQEQIAAMDIDADTDRFLLCGNPAMVDDVYSHLKQRGFGPRQVTREKYVFARESGATRIAELSAAQKKLLKEKLALYKK